MDETGLTAETDGGEEGRCADSRALLQALHAPSRSCRVATHGQAELKELIKFVRCCGGLIAISARRRCVELLFCDRTV